jgi:hypothetical protein
MLFLKPQIKGLSLDKLAALVSDAEYRIGLMQLEGIQMSII